MLVASWNLKCLKWPWKRLSFLDSPFLFQGKRNSMWHVMLSHVGLTECFSSVRRTPRASEMEPWCLASEQNPNPKCVQVNGNGTWIWTKPEPEKKHKKRDTWTWSSLTFGQHIFTAQEILHYYWKWYLVSAAAIRESGKLQPDFFI